MTEKQQAAIVELMRSPRRIVQLTEGRRDGRVSLTRYRSGGRNEPPHGCWLIAADGTVEWEEQYLD